MLLPQVYQVARSKLKELKKITMRLEKGTTAKTLPFFYKGWQ